MKRKGKLLLIIVAIIVIIFLIYYFFGRGNSNALWEIVSQQCVPNQQQNNNPSPCKKVDLTKRFVLFKDAKGPYHDLIMPTYHISGIEDPRLQSEQTPPFLAMAWNEKDQLKNEIGKAVNDDKIALAVNSKYGRSQNLLHIHLACLSEAAWQLLEQEKANISTSWQPLAGKINGHQYLAKRINNNELAQINPFQLLHDLAISQGDKSTAKYGLAVTQLTDGSSVLLTTRFNLLKFNLGSAGEIQDYKCSLAKVNAG